MITTSTTTTTTITIWEEMYRRGKGKKSGTKVLTSPYVPDLPKHSLRLKIVSRATLHPRLYD